MRGAKPLSLLCHEPHVSEQKALTSALREIFIIATDFILARSQKTRRYVLGRDAWATKGLRWCPGCGLHWDCGCTCAVEVLRLLERMTMKPKSWIIFWYSCEHHTACPGTGSSCKATCCPLFFFFFFFCLWEKSSYFNLDFTWIHGKCHTGICQAFQPESVLLGLEMQKEVPPTRITNLLTWWDSSSEAPLKPQWENSSLMETPAWDVSQALWIH